jgi:glycosyltransferase involved in cell wall biosynthesis
MSEAIEELGTYLIPSVFGLVLFASPIIDILFTQQYEAAVPYLRIYSLDYLCLMIPFDAVQRARGDSLWILKNSAVFLMISLTLGVAAVPILGAYGPLSILLITHILIRFSALRYLKLKMSWDWHQVIPSKTLLRFALVSTGFSGIALLIRPLFASQTQWFLSCGPVIMILYLGTVLPWRWGEKAKRSSELRILMITQYLGIGGLEKMIFHLSHGLQKAQRKRAFVFAYEETEKTAELLELFEAHSIQVEIYRKHRGFSPLAVFKLVSYIFQNDIHLVHTHDLGALIYGAFAKVFSLGKVKLVHSQHTFVHLEKFGKRVGSKYAIYEKIFSLVPNQICPVSESIRDRYIELGLNPKRAQVILNGTPFPQHHSTPSMTPEAHPESRRQLLIKSIQSEPIRLRLLEQSRDIWILCLARISIEKGQRHILKIWENLPEADKAATTLLFVGPLSSSSPEPPEPCDLRFSNRVFYLGPTQKPDLWIRESHLFVSGSEFEGLPLGPLEALGSGRPAFLSNIAGHQLLSPWSELFSLEKLDQASQQLSQLIQKIQTQRTLDQTESYYQELWNRTSNLRETFSLEKMVKSYGEIYDRTYL